MPPATPTPELLRSTAGRLGRPARLARRLRALVSERPYEARSLADRARARALTTVVRLRLVIAPVLGSFSLTFAFFEPTPWRRAVLAAAVLLLFGLSVIEWARFRRHGLSAVRVPVNVLLTALGQLMIVSATGGLFSPVVAAVIMLVLLSGLLTERGALASLLGSVIPCFWLLACAHAYGWPASLVPAIFGGAQPLEHGPAPWIAAGLFTLISSVAARVGSGVQRLFEELFAESISERDRALALHAEQSRALTTLTGEIAHELKNPLSSVKGLAALVAKDLDGRTAERVAVLRQEVDRMQGILEEFLNFSRPLVPLAVVDVDLGELAREVARLHEGSALERAVELAVQSEEDAHLRGDTRKIRQVLINLVQNALDASPADTTVTLSVAADGEHLQLSVRDHGRGIPAELGERVFEAGVTQKEHGSGLGLAVARSLARQHGGELSLRNHPEGGAVAELRLPREPKGQHDGELSLRDHPEHDALRELSPPREPKGVSR